MPAQGAHLGRVVSLDGGDAVVRFTRSAMCAHCCGCLAIGEKEMQLRVKNTLNARAGDTVEVNIEARSLVLASLLAYCVPLALLVGGLSIGSLVSDAVSALTGLACCAVGFLALRLLEPKLRAKHRFTPRMRAILNTEVTNDGEEGSPSAFHDGEL